MLFTSIHYAIYKNFGTQNRWSQTRHVRTFGPLGHQTQSPFVWPLEPWRDHDKNCFSRLVSNAVKLGSTWKCTNQIPPATALFSLNLHDIFFVDCRVIFTPTTAERHRMHCQPSHLKCWPRISITKMRCKNICLFFRG